MLEILETKYVKEIKLSEVFTGCLKIQKYSIYFYIFFLYQDQF